jgi:hypothetical protein
LVHRETVSSGSARAPALITPTCRQHIGLHTTEAVEWICFGNRERPTRDHGEPLARGNTTLYRHSLTIDGLRMKDGRLQTVTGVSNQRNKQWRCSRISGAALGKE